MKLIKSSQLCPGDIVAYKEVPHKHRVVVEIFQDHTRKHLYVTTVTVEGYIQATSETPEWVAVKCQACPMHDGTGYRCKTRFERILEAS